MWLQADWFNLMMNAIVKTKTANENLNYPVIANERNEIIEKIMRYGWYEENKEKREARIEFFPSETREVIWALLEYIAMIDGYECENYYEEFKEKHDELKNGKEVS